MNNNAHPPHERQLAGIDTVAEAIEIFQHQVTTAISNNKCGWHSVKVKLVRGHVRTVQVCSDLELVGEKTKTRI